ncbi:MAG: hypothetical protein IKU11_10315 [Clostridia bacterium]|nr:hypothetical protein [Clostridia bacterium]
MKKPLAILCVAILLCTLAACGRNGVVEDTETESQTTTLPQTQTEPAPSTTPVPESETQSETMSETETATETETETDSGSLMTDFAEFFDMTRDEIMGKRGESENTTAPADDNNLYYTDRYAGYEGQAGYAFGDDGTLSDISLTFPDGVTLEDVTEALEGLHGSAIDQNGVSTWHKDGITYQMLQENGKLVLRVTRQENAQSDVTTTTKE